MMIISQQINKYDANTNKKSHSGINFTKYFIRLYHENYKTLSIETKEDLHKCNNVPGL